MRKWLEEKLRIHWHKANDSRFWIHIGNACIAIEMYFFKKARHCILMLHLNDGDGDQITFGVGLPKLFCFWVSLESRLLSRLLPYKIVDSSLRPDEKFKMPIGRDIGIRIFDGAIWFSLWDNPNEGSSADPWWWAFNFRPVDFLLGRESIIEKRRTCRQSISVRLPENIYTGTVELYRVSYKRPRWFASHYDRFSLDMNTPIPIPGKGECEYDIGEDAIYSMSGCAKTVDEAVINLLNSVNSARVRYGGALWLPDNSVIAE